MDFEQYLQPGAGAGDRVRRIRRLQRVVFHVRAGIGHERNRVEGDAPADQQLAGGDLAGVDAAWRRAGVVAITSVSAEDPNPRPVFVEARERCNHDPRPAEGRVARDIDAGEEEQAARQPIGRRRLLRRGRRRAKAQRRRAQTPRRARPRERPCLPPSPHAVMDGNRVVRAALSIRACIEPIEGCKLLKLHEIPRAFLHAIHSQFA